MLKNESIALNKLLINKTFADLKNKISEVVLDNQQAEILKAEIDSALQNIMQEVTGLDTVTDNVPGLGAVPGGLPVDLGTVTDNVPGLGAVTGAVPGLGAAAPVTQVAEALGGKIVGSIVGNKEGATKAPSALSTNIISLANQEVILTNYSSQVEQTLHVIDPNSGKGKLAINSKPFDLNHRLVTITAVMNNVDVENFKIQWGVTKDNSINKLLVTSYPAADLMDQLSVIGEIGEDIVPAA